MFFRHIALSHLNGHSVVRTSVCLHVCLHAYLSVCLYICSIYKPSSIFFSVMTMSVETAFIRLLPYTLYKYWTLSDCYHTHSPSTDLYRSYHTHSPSTGDSQTVTALIVQVLAFIRLLLYALSIYWTLSTC